MTVPFYGHVKQYHNIKSEIDANIHEVLESGQYVMGPMLKRFEKEFADYHGLKHAIGVGNGTYPCRHSPIVGIEWRRCNHDGAEPRRRKTGAGGTRCLSDCVL